MPVLSVSLTVSAGLFVSADKAACVLAWELSEPASTRFTRAFKEALPSAQAASLLMHS